MFTLSCVMCGEEFFIDVMFSIDGEVVCAECADNAYSISPQDLLDTVDDASFSEMW